MLAFSQTLDFLDDMSSFSFEIELLTQSYYLLPEYEYASDTFKKLFWKVILCIYLFK